MFKLALVAAVAVPAMASGGLRGGRGLAVDDIKSFNTCKGSYDIVFTSPPSGDGVVIDATNGCVNYPSIYNETSGNAWRPFLPGFCFCDNFCDALDDCCEDFCDACSEFPNAEDDITVYFGPDVDTTGLSGEEVEAAFEDSVQKPYNPKGRQETDEDEFFFPEAPLCLVPTFPPSFDPNPADNTCSIDIPYEMFDEGFPWIQYENSVADGRFSGEDFYDGRPLQWLMSVEKVSEVEVLPWADSDLSILDSVLCDGEALVSPTNTETDDRYVLNYDPCDWIPYIGNGWQELPKCTVIPALGRHRANARHRKAIDMGMQRAQDCCRDCSPLNAVQYARTTMVLDPNAYPTGWEGTIRFVGNDGAVIWNEGTRVHEENTCSSATGGRSKEIPFSLKAGANVIVVKARNHGKLIRELNHGFFMKFTDDDVVAALTLDINITPEVPVLPATP